MRERLINQLRETGNYIKENCDEDRYGLEREVARLSAELEGQKKNARTAATIQGAGNKNNTYSVTETGGKSNG